MGFFSALLGRNVSGGKDIQPDMTNGPTRDRVVLHVEWCSPDRIVELCGPGKIACNTRWPQQIDGEWHAYIACPPPVDFNDFNRLETLGHEVFHALGANHG